MFRTTTEPRPQDALFAAAAYQAAFFALLCLSVFVAVIRVYGLGLSDFTWAGVDGFVAAAPWPI
jgi:hypothetical protein